MSIYRIYHGKLQNMTTSLLNELQDETCPVTLQNLQIISKGLSHTYAQATEVNLENSTFGQMVSNTLLIAKRAFVFGSYEPDDLITPQFDAKVVNWLQFRERLLKSPVILQVNLATLLELLSVMHRDVFSELESTLKGLNKSLSSLLNKPTELNSISGNQSIVLDKKHMIDSSTLDKLKGSIKDQPVNVKVGRIFNSVSEIRTLAGSLHTLNYDYARIELKDILDLHNRTVELLQTLVEDSKGQSSGNTAKNLVNTIIGLATTLEALGASVTLLDKLTILMNEAITSANEAQQITLSENKA